MSAVTSRADPGATPLLDRAAAPAAPAARSTMPGAITLGMLLARVGDAIKAGLPDPVWVLAAVAAAKPVRGGHMLELAEAEARGDGSLRAYLPDAILAPLAAAVGRTVAAAELVGVTITLKLVCSFNPKWGLGARVLALGPGIEASIAQRALEAAIARLRIEGLLKRQRLLPSPVDITLVSVIHPPAAAGWADIEGELQRWVGAGVLALRDIPTAFEGSDASDGFVVAVARAVAVVDSRRPDLVLVVRGGGARVGLAALDAEPLARAIATAPVPVVTGTGHRIDRSLADLVAWRTTDTPSKALSLLRDLIATPARRARQDHEAILAAAASGAERAEAALDALERRISAAALQRVMAAAADLGAGWSLIGEAAAAARERCGRLVDGLDRLAGDVATAVPAQLDRAATQLATLVDGIRATARSRADVAPDGASLLAGIEARAWAHRETATSDLVRLAHEIAAAPPRRLDQAAADLSVLMEAIRARARDGCVATDDGSRHLAAIAARVASLVAAETAEIERRVDRIRAAVPERLDRLAAELDRALLVLDAHDPRLVLARGYALALDPEGRVLTTAVAARSAGPFTLTFADGALVVAPQPTQPPMTGAQL